MVRTVLSAGRSSRDSARTRLSRPASTTAARFIVAGLTPGRAPQILNTGHAASVKALLQYWAP